MDRQETIGKIIAASHRPIPKIVERHDLQDPATGRVYSIFGLPDIAYHETMVPVNHRFVYQGPDGATYGRAYKTQEEAVTAWGDYQAESDASFRQSLDAMSAPRLDECATYWLR